MNIVSVGEVYDLSGKSRDREFAERVMAALRGPAAVVSGSDELAMAAAQIKAHRPISYADAFAAATALSLGSALVTGDPYVGVMPEKKPALQIEWQGRA